MKDLDIYLTVQFLYMGERFCLTPKVFQQLLSAALTGEWVHIKKKYFIAYVYDCLMFIME